MSMGYQGYAELGGFKFLVTSASVPENSVRIDSNSGWGGDGTGATHGIKIPRAYDWSSNEGSVSYDLMVGMGSLLKGWVTARMSSKSLHIVPSFGSDQLFNEVYWTSITIGASENSLVAGDISVLAITRNNESIASEYITDREGEATCSTLMNPLNPGASNLSPVPFWKSIVSGSAVSGVEAMSWTLNFTQEITKIFACEANFEAQPPTILGFGPMVVDLQMELFIPSGSEYVIQDRATCNIALGEGTTFALGQMELQAHQQDIKGQSDISTVSVDYHAFTL